MPFVPAGGDHATQMKAMIEQLRRLPLGLFVGFVFPDKDLDLLSQEATNRGAAPSGQDFGLSQGLSA
jgi:hypothetical protein